MGTDLDIDINSVKELLTKLAKSAASQNMSVTQLLNNYVPGFETVTAKTSETPGVNGTDRVNAFEQWVSSLPSETPLLSDEDISRASIYRNR